MDDILRKAGITDVYLGGIATDVCVAYSAFHSLELGFRTVLIDDCCRGIVESDIKNTFDRIRTENGVIVQAHEVGAMVQGQDRRFELGYQWAIELSKK
jgi:nicotinamidase-related amidase